MEIIEPRTEVMAMTGHEELPFHYQPDPKILMEVAGRNCYKSETAVTKHSSQVFVERREREGHLTILEHSWESRLFFNIPECKLKFIAGNWSKYFYFSQYNPIVAGNFRAWKEAEDKITFPSEYSILPEDEIRKLAKQNNEPFLMRATVRIICDRGVSHEVVRARTPVYSQESTRWVNYLKKKIQFLVPPWVNKNNFNIFSIFSKRSRADLLWFIACWGSEHIYNALIELGWNPQQARSVLINSLKTEIVMSDTLEGFQHFFGQRILGLTGKPHPQMKEAIWPLYLKFIKLEPDFFTVNQIKNISTRSKL